MPENRPDAVDPVAADGQENAEAPAAPPLTSSSGPPPAAPAPLRAATTSHAKSSGGGFHDLPKYSRSLLKIKVPVVVHLAAKKQAVSQILRLGPGSIIKFDKSCDESLDMCIGGRKVAEGEAVKVGESFGLRISTIALPEERFKPAQRPATSR